MTGALIDRARYLQQIDHEIAVAYDEWNVWYRTDDGRLEERYTLADALAVATYLNVFVRQCRIVRMANLAQLVNVIAPIVTSPGGLFLQSIYHPFRLMASRDAGGGAGHLRRLRHPARTDRPGALAPPGERSRAVPAAGRGRDPRRRPGG